MGQNLKKSNRKTGSLKNSGSKKKSLAVSANKRNSKAVDDRQLLKDWEHVT